ncbi:MAG TPA: lysine-sensitive aspartokinase 3, partial [Blastocatellia bacterium]|nr:lysine-sensitive aspartokinase 3 [Blastocatellia bacterium]
TSVEDVTAIQRLISIVRTQLHRRPVVVVSAMGRTTNRLLECAELAGNGQLEAARGKLEAVAAHHFNTAQQLALPEEAASLQETLGRRFNEIRELLGETAEAKRVTSRLSDAISANGELLSSQIVAAGFRQAGWRGVWVDIRPAMRTDGEFTRASVQFEEANPALKMLFSEALAHDGVPVTQGFIGSTVNGVTTTIGRGGSDYSASIVGAALEAEEIQIWTDVDGIMTTDPRIVPEAAKVKIISFAEASELAYFGAKVLHPSTLMPAMAKEIPVCVCNSRRPEVSGTAIVRNSPPSGALVKAIAFKRGITVVNVTSDRMLMAHGFLARLFEVFNKHRISVDMVSTSEVSVSMTLDSDRNLDLAVADLQQFGEVAVEGAQALICLVGENLKYKAGLAARAFSSLGKINVSMISHGASAINLSFIVNDLDVEQAVQLLHGEFFSELDAETFESPVTVQAAAPN